MNHLTKTYGIVINLDYSHQSKKECHAVWDKIVKNMLLYDFHSDKRMFIMTTEKGKDFVCDKARQVLNSLDKDRKFDDQSSFHYIIDFFEVDMSDYVDLRLPHVDSGVILKEAHSQSISYSL